jgi:hypothetical protein
LISQGALEPPGYLEAQTLKAGKTGPISALAAKKPMFITPAPKANRNLVSREAADDHGKWERCKNSSLALTFYVYVVGK